VETPKQYHSELELGQDQIQALINANRAVVSVSMSTYEYETTAVKLYTDYEFILWIGVISNLENE
jgi:hypothetical protein